MGIKCCRWDPISLGPLGLSLAAYHAYLTERRELDLQRPNQTVVRLWRMLCFKKFLHGILRVDQATMHGFLKQRIKSISYDNNNNNNVLIEGPIYPHPCLKIFNEK